MKKLFVILLALLLCVALVSCNIVVRPGNGGNGGLLGGDYNDDEADKDGKEEQGEPNAPLYELLFVSNGDGTCRLDNIRVNQNAEQGFALVIPEYSPDGDLVTSIKADYTKEWHNFPIIMEESLYQSYVVEPLEERLCEIEEKIGVDNNAYENVLYALLVLDAWFLPYDPSMEDRYFDNVPKEIREYAAEKNVRLYCLDTYSECSITDREMQKLQNLFYEHLPNACGPYSPAIATEREIAQRYPDSVYARAVEHLDHPNTPKNIESIVIPAGVTEICGGAFYDASDLKSVTFAEGSMLTSIGGYAFFGCSALAEITIPISVTEIGYYAFSGCSALTEITVPRRVTEIGRGTFENCRSLTSVQLYCLLEWIDEDAFVGCDSLCEIRYEGTVAEWARVVKGDVPCPVFCMDGTVEPRVFPYG